MQKSEQPFCFLQSAFSIHYAWCSRPVRFAWFKIIDFNWNKFADKLFINNNKWEIDFHSRFFTQAVIHLTTTITFCITIQPAPCLLQIESLITIVVAFSFYLWWPAWPLFMFVHKWTDHAAPGMYDRGYWIKKEEGKMVETQYGLHCTIKTVVGHMLVILYMMIIFMGFEVMSIAAYMGNMSTGR
jgi:hypothetical protein